MASVSYVGKVLKDGHLSLPKEAKEKLKLKAGQEVQVVLRVADEEEPDDKAYTHLYRLIGLAKQGRRDASVRHDKYLYGKREQ